MDDIILLTSDDGPDSVITVSGDYKISSLNKQLDYVDKTFYESERMYPLAAVMIVLISVTISIVGVIPLAVVPNPVLPVVWDVLYIPRMVAYGIVYAANWMILLRYAYRYCLGIDDYYRLSLGQFILAGVFAALYAGLYAWVWVATPGIFWRAPAITLGTISLFIVYFVVLSQQLVSTPTTALGRRQRSILLASIKLARQQSSVDHVAETIVNRLQSRTGSAFSLFISARTDHVFYTQNRERLLNSYEEDSYDRYGSIRTALTNCLLGVVSLALWMAIIEDYGWAVANTTHLTDDGYVWLVSVMAGVLSFLYMICGYSRAHQTIDKVWSFLTLRDSISIAKSCCWHLPFHVIGALVASIRLEASHIAFSRLAAKYKLPLSAGYTLIYTAMACVFFIDMMASSKLVNAALTEIVTLVGSYGWGWKCCNKLECQYTCAYYSNRAKTFIRHADIFILQRATQDLTYR